MYMSVQFLRMTDQTEQCLDNCPIITKKIFCGLGGVKEREAPTHLIENSKLTNAGRVTKN